MASRLRRRANGSDRIGLAAWSRRTEAAFLAADRNADAVGAVVGYAPSAYVFPAFPPTDPPTSAWSTGGEPAPFLPPYHGIEAGENEPGVVRFRRTVERASPEQVTRATLPVANIDGPVLLVAGTDDRVWPSAEFAEELADRPEAADHQWACRCNTYGDAGHGITVPYEMIEQRVLDAMGGTRDGTLYAATDAWERMLETFRDGLYR